MISNRFARALVSVLLLGVACLGCEPPKRKTVTGPRIAVIDLRGGLPETMVADGLMPIPADQTYVGLVRKLSAMKVGDDVRGIFVRASDQIPLHAAMELGDALYVLRKNGMPVVCHSHEVGNAGVAFLLAACDERWVSAAGDVSTVGIAAEVVYLKGLFDKFGITADMVSMGQYKSAVETFTREGPSEATARNMNELLAGLRAAWLGYAARALAPADSAAVLAALEDGPWAPPAALRQGLVTHVGFEDQALDSARTRASTDETEHIFGGARRDGAGPDVAELVRFLSGKKAISPRGRVAVLPAIGAISMNPGGPLGEAGIYAASTVRSLRRLREDEGVKAIVLRLDSPGGSPLASDLIWREVMLTRQRKPIIVSIGGMAASGGYYIASAGTKIVASQTAIVGSIGVFGGKIVFGEALENFGVTSHAFPANPDPKLKGRALHMSPLSTWDEATRGRVRDNMKHIYDLFVSRVAEGRRMDPGAVYATAEGAVFLAEVGKARGLVDEIGGVSRALALAFELADLPEDAPVTVEGGGETLLEMLFLNDEPAAADVRAALQRYAVEQGRGMSLFGEKGPMMREALSDLSGAVTPLVQGETVVAALPYAIRIQ